MIVIGREKLRAYQLEFASARKALSAWTEVAEKASWLNPQDVKSTFGTASIMGRGSDRVVFNIKGNDFRLVVRIDYVRQIVAIRWLGTHAAYDRIDIMTI